MTTINLYQNPEELEHKGTSRVANGGFFFSLSILVITVAVIFGLKYYVASVDSKNKVLSDSVAQQSQGLVGVSSLQRVLDIQTRLSMIKNNLQINNGTVGQLKMTDVLDHLGSDLNSGVVVSKYSYDDSGEVKVTFSANNFNDIARQILNFKKSAYFSNAAVGNIVRGDTDISADMTMTVKTQS